MRGRKPLPTHLKLLRGNPGKRRLQPALQILPPPAPLPAPEFLTGYAREEWERVAPQLTALRCLSPLDVASLRVYCETYKRWRTAVETISEMEGRDPVTHGLIVKTQSGGAVPNPFVWIAQNAARDLIRFAAEFGLTPSARSRIHAVEAIGAGKFTGLFGHDDPA